MVMRVPDKSAALVSLPGHGSGPVRHGLSLGAPVLLGASGAAAFDGGLGDRQGVMRGLADLAEAGARVGLKLRRERAEAEAADAYAALGAAMEGELYGEQGLFSHRGRESLGSVERFRTFFDTAVAERSKGMSGEASRLFAEQATGLRLSTVGAVARHEGAQRKAWRLEGLKGAAAADCNTALRDFADERAFSGHRERFLARVAEVGRAAAMDEGRIAALLGGADADLAAGRIARYAQSGDFHSAYELLQAAPLDEERRARAARALKGAYAEALADEARINPDGVLAELEGPALAGPDKGAGRRADGAPGSPLLPSEANAAAASEPDAAGASAPNAAASSEPAGPHGLDAMLSPADRLLVTSAGRAALQERDLAIENALELLPHASRRYLAQGDHSGLDAVEALLAGTGATGAAALARHRERRELLQPLRVLLHDARAESFSSRERLLASFFAESAGPENAAWPDGLKEDAFQSLQDERERFARDPTGHVAEHPLLGREGLDEEAFCRREGISLEEHIARSLRIQAHMGEGPGEEGAAPPRALPLSRAAAVADRYDSLAGDPRGRADFVRELAAKSGAYAPMVLAEAGLPVGLAAFARVLPDLPLSQSGRLVQAAGMRLDDMDLPGGRKEEARRRVAASPLARALLTAGKALGALDPRPVRPAPGRAAPGRAAQDSAASNSFGPNDSGPDHSGPDSAASDAVRALEVFAALGGNLPGLERRVALAAAPRAGDVARVIAARVAGAVSLADRVASPLYLAANAVNALFGGAPDSSRPMGGGFSDLLGLPAPHNDAEELVHSMLRGGSEAAFTAWGAGALMTFTAATSVPGAAWGVVNALRAGPGGHAAAGAAA